jgi:Lipase (class 3)
MDGIKGLQTRKAISLTKDLIKKEKGNIKRLYFTGHSLGGFLASWVQSEVVDGDIKVSVTSKAYVFNAPGISTVNVLGIPLVSVISRVPNPFLKIFNNPFFYSII